MALNLGFWAWSAQPSTAERMLMPARIMTASWLVKFWMSLALGPKLKDMFIAPLPPRPSAGASAMMYSPRWRSCCDAAARSGAFRKPDCTLPACERVSYRYVGITTHRLRRPSPCGQVTGDPCDFSATRLVPGATGAPGTKRVTLRDLRSRPGRHGPALRRFATRL